MPVSRGFGKNSNVVSRGFGGFGIIADIWQQIVYFTLKLTSSRYGDR